MLSDQEIDVAKERLVNDKLTGSDVDDLVSAFRLVLGPLEVKYEYKLSDDLQSLDDSNDDRQRAAKMAAGLIRLKEEDFGVATLSGELLNSDEEQRKLFTLYLFSLIHTIPAEIAYNDLFARIEAASKIRSTSVRVRFVK